MPVHAAIFILLNGGRRSGPKNPMHCSQILITTSVYKVPLHSVPCCSVSVEKPSGGNVVCERKL